MVSSWPSSDRYRWRLWWGGPCRDLGMPESGTSWRVTLWAAEGRLCMQPLLLGRGRVRYEAATRSNCENTRADSVDSYKAGIEKVAVHCAVYGFIRYIERGLWGQ